MPVGFLWACRHYKAILISMLTAFFFAAVLVMATTLLHYEVLCFLSYYLSISVRLRILFIICGIFMAHITEILFYAMGYYLLRDHSGLGSFAGTFKDTFASYLYFSMETFTTLGFGDIYPTGYIRFITGVETLNGLLLIGWSVSFTYLVMQQFWFGRENYRR